MLDDNLMGDGSVSGSSLIHSLSSNHLDELLLILHDGTVEVLSGVDDEWGIFVVEELDFHPC